MKIPFEYGTIAENEYFIDREEDRKELKTLLGGGINVALVSPRRWGKSSLVKAATDELMKEDRKVKICHLDAFTVMSEEDFYNKFASAVVRSAASGLEKSLADFKTFVQSIVPSVSFSLDQSNTIDLKLHYSPMKESAEKILDIPERIAEAKGIHMIVCIDEFQELAKFPGWKKMEGTMRSVWQKHHHSNYCLYGSKRHMMMNIFGNSNDPFYRFGQLMTLGKISKKHWVPFITKSFRDYGKRISEDTAGRICDAVECHSWYVQQFCFLIWTHTEDAVTEEIFGKQLSALIDTNAAMFVQDIESLSVSQISLLKAVAAGESRLHSMAAAAKYNLGSAGNITKNRRILIERDFIEKAPDRTLHFVDPVFGMWLKREFA